MESFNFVKKQLKPHQQVEHGFCCDWQAPVPWQTRRCMSNTCDAPLAGRQLVAEAQPAGPLGAGGR